MKYRITTVQEVEINDFPAFLKWEHVYCKVYGENKVLRAISDPIIGHSLETCRTITNHERWEHITEAEFCEVAASAHYHLMQAANIELLELQGGAYAD
jgi:hypothetical protein